MVFDLTERFYNELYRIRIRISTCCFSFIHFDEPNTNMRQQREIRALLTIFPVVISSHIIVFVYIKLHTTKRVARRRRDAFGWLISLKLIYKKTVYFYIEPWFYVCSRLQGAEHIFKYHIAPRSLRMCTLITLSIDIHAYALYVV